MGWVRVKLKQWSEINKVNERMGGTNQPRAFPTVYQPKLKKSIQNRFKKQNPFPPFFLSLCFLLSASDSCFNPKIGGDTDPYSFPERETATQQPMHQKRLFRRPI
jgi:hypothetical protein